MIQIGGFRPGIFSVVCVMILSMSSQAQNRGVYPLGMTATNSGVTPAPGFTYVNQLLFCSRDHAKDDKGDTLTVTGENYVPYGHEYIGLGSFYVPRIFRAVSGSMSF